MKIQTSRFGELEVDDSRIITFPKGLLGFAKYTHFALIQPSEESVFFWLQCTQRTELAFVVVDPSIFLSDYRVQLKGEELGIIELSDPKLAQVLVVVNKVAGMLTANLQGPLVINSARCLGKQLVLSDKKHTTRHPLMRLGAESEPLAKSA